MTSEWDTAAQATIEHVNSTHADAVVFLARHHIGEREAADAELLSIDRSGVDLEVVNQHGRQLHRVDFAAEVDTPADIQAQLIGLIAAARTRVGDGPPLTSIERELANRSRIRSFSVEVVRRTPLTSSLIEIVVTGDLIGFDVTGGDDFVFVMVARDGVIDPDYTIERFMADEPDDRPFGAYYTVRRWNPDSGELTMWMIDHGHPGGVGGWAQHCKPGDRAVIWGPRDGAAAPTDGTPIIITVDESGWAAAVGLAERVRAGTDVTIIAEAADSEHRHDLGWPTHWVSRDGASAGTSGALLAALQALDLDPTEPRWFFGAAESREVTAIRKYLRRDLGYPATSVSMVGYWRR